MAMYAKFCNAQTVLYLSYRFTLKYQWNLTVSAHYQCPWRLCVSWGETLLVRHLMNETHSFSSTLSELAQGGLDVQHHQQPDVSVSIVPPIIYCLLTFRC